MLPSSLTLPHNIIVDVVLHSAVCLLMNEALTLIVASNNQTNKKPKPLNSLSSPLTQLTETPKINTPLYLRYSYSITPYFLPTYTINKEQENHNILNIIPIIPNELNQ